MPEFFLVLLGAAKHDPVLLMPCGSYQFLYDSASNRHLLDGRALTIERFHEAAEDMARRWPAATRYRVVPLVRLETATAPPAGWEEERARLLAERDGLQAQLDQEELIHSMQKPRRSAVAPPPLTTP